MSTITESTEAESTDSKRKVVAHRQVTVQVRHLVWSYVAVFILCGWIFTTAPHAEHKAMGSPTPSTALAASDSAPKAP